MDELSAGFGWTLSGDNGRQDRLDAFERAVTLLHVELQHRIEREEGIGGFFAFLCAAQPRYLSILPTLRAQHARLLDTTADLQGKIARAPNHAFPTLVAEAAALLGAIEEHEALESELLRDALESEG